jgi:hypothetical protein
MFDPVLGKGVGGIKNREKFNTSKFQRISTATKKRKKY